MKKISIEYILLYLEVVFAGILILILLAYNISVKQDDFWDRGMYSENVEGVQLSNQYLVTVKGEQVEFDIKRLDKSIKYAIYKTLSEEYDEIIRGIYQTKELFHMDDYIESGRFFEEEDFDNSNPVAVIGADMMEHTIEQNGKIYFGYYRLSVRKGNYDRCDQVEKQSAKSRGYRQKLPEQILRRACQAFAFQKGGKKGKKAYKNRLHTRSRQRVCSRYDNS